jgi:hypothetical protein
MPDEGFDHDVVRELLDETEAIGQAAKVQRSFQSVYDAFEKEDAKAFQTALKRLRLFPRCHLICRWIRVKYCVFLCLRLCGLPSRDLKPPNPRRLAEAIVKLTSDEKAVQQLADAVEKGNRAAFQRLVKAHGLEEYCHFFCHWVCVVRYRLVCRWICEPGILQRPSLAGELHAAGLALRGLLKSDQFDAAVAAAQAGDAEKLRAAIDKAGIFHLCHFVCEWFCSWRCALVCLTVCREFPIAQVDDPRKEAFEFAQAIQVFRERLPDLERLAAAVGKGDVQEFSRIVRELKLERFCLQLCHWICYRRCFRFCFVVCPPPDTIPLFTHVGAYHVDPVYGDFQPDGTTTAGHFAFTRTIPLIGIMPDGTASEAVEYRFRIAKHPGLAPVQDVVASMVAPTKIGELEYWYWNGLFWTLGSADYWVNNPGATATIPQHFGPPLTTSVNQTVKPGGWIEVPRDNDLSIGGHGRFVRSSDRLVDLDTTKFTNETFDLRVPAPGLRAGDTVPMAKRSEAPTYRIFFEARKVVGGAAVSANQLDKIAFSNTHYTYTRHTEWAGGDVTTKTVCSLDIAELIAPGATGCDRLHNHVHALFTTYHPYLDSVSISFEGVGVPPPAPFSPAIAGGHAASGAAGHDFNITSLHPCAYILWLSASVRLTEGWGLIPDATDTDHIAFCKQ